MFTGPSGVIPSSAPSIKMRAPAGSVRTVRRPVDADGSAGEAIGGGVLAAGAGAGVRDAKPTATAATSATVAPTPLHSIAARRLATVGVTPDVAVVSRPSAVIVSV